MVSTKDVKCGLDSPYGHCILKKGHKGSHKTADDIIWGGVYGC